MITVLFRRSYTGGSSDRPASAADLVTNELGRGSVTQYSISNIAVLPHDALAPKGWSDLALTRTNLAYESSQGSLPRKLSMHVLLARSSLTT